MAKRLNGPNLPTRVTSRLWGWTHRFDATGTKRDRAIQLITTVAATVLVLGLTNWITGSDLFQNLFFPALDTTPQVRAWSARVYAAIFVLGLPVAFLLWHWRDRNMRDQIENARKDINLKEFQEVQLRAAGALDEKLPGAAREQLQIAALHQLRGFLRGNYGDAFRRPAFELLLALHRSMGERLKAPHFRMEALKPPADGNWRRKGKAIRKSGKRLRDLQTSLEKTASEVILSEWHAIWHSGFPLTSRNLDLIAVPRHAVLSNLKLTDSHFAGAFLCEAHFQGADLMGSHLEGAELIEANLEGAELTNAHLEGADLTRAHVECAVLTRAHLEGADLYGAVFKRAKLTAAHLEGAVLFGVDLEGAELIEAHLEGADLTWAHLEGTILIGSHLEGADLRGSNWEKAIFSPNAFCSAATFNNATVLLHNWEHASEDQRNQARDELRALGARHVDDLPPNAQGADREAGADEMGAAGAA